MRKSFTLFAVLYCTVNLNAQSIPLKSFKTIPVKNLSGHSIPGGVCDSLNIYNANDWPAFYYEYRGGGSVFGVSHLNASSAKTYEDANYFDASSSNYNFIRGGLVYFAIANSNVPANLDKNIVFKLYDDAGGLPGALIASDTLTLNQIHQDVMAGKLTEFKFESPLKLPLSKKFYIAVDHSNFKWSLNNHDSIAIVATGDDKTTNSAFQYTYTTQSGKKWYPVNQFWKNEQNSLDVSLFIFPYVSNSADGCVVLPVSIFNFGGAIKNNQVNLNWSTATESNNKGFYVERSNNGKDFSSIGFVKGAGNSSKITNYTYTDALIKELTVTTTYYRLKQVDIDGKFTYSQVLSLNLQNVVRSKLYPNPVKDIATIELNLDAASKVTAQLISRDGKVLLNIDKGILSEGTQQFSINAQSLAKGTYLIRIKAGDKMYSLNMVKE